MRIALIALIALVLPQDKPTWPQLVERGKKDVERMKELRAAMPREHFDLAALSKSLDGDPAKAAEFVKARIALEPVRGFAKGAQGALVSGSAGWADRALLLAALVPGQSPKLVRGTLAAAKQPALPGSPAAIAAAAPADVAARLKIDPARLEKKSLAAAEAAAASREQAWTRIRRDLDALAAALDAAGVAPPQAVAAPPDEVWWVRIGDRDYGKPDGAEERAAISPSEIPSEDAHKLQIRMKIRQGDAETVVLHVAFNTMDLFGRSLTLSTVAGENTAKLNKLQSMKAKDHLDVLAATTVFVPLLSGGAKPVTGHPFDLTGSKVAVKNGAIQKLGGALATIEDLPFGEEKKKKELTGASLEVVLSPPDGAPVVATRELLAKGSTGRQRVFDLLATREILVLPGDLRGDFALDRALESDIAVKEALLRQMQPKALFVEKRPSRLNARLYQFALARAAARRELAAGLKMPVGPGTTVVSFVSRVLDGKPSKVRGGFDILCNRTQNLAAASSWKADPAFAAGIVDTALEHEVHRIKGAHSNASVRMEQAKGEGLRVERQGDRLRVVVPGTPAAWYTIDPATGSCLGYTDEGGGQDMAEYATLLADTLEEIREWQSHAELLNSVLECAMNALEAQDAEGSFARCMAGVAIGEAFGWAAGGIIGGAAGDNPFARLGGMGLEDWMTDTFGDALEGAMGGH